MVNRDKVRLALAHVLAHTSRSSRIALAFELGIDAKAEGAPSRMAEAVISAFAPVPERDERPVAWLVVEDTDRKIASFLNVEEAKRCAAASHEMNPAHEYAVAPLTRPAPSAPSGEDREFCPVCHAKLKRVTQEAGSMLNAEQFNATKAGDWYCDNLAVTHSTLFRRARTGFAYFSNAELHPPEPR